MLPKIKSSQSLKADILASLVVFLVALPLCLGIAIASGAPPITGILSGIIGGLVVATLGGSPMQVSGPANGLIVLVLLITQQYGLALLGVVVLAAGVLQLTAGIFRLGQLFRAIPPTIIHGLMTGFAVIIFASQFHVMLDDPTRGSAMQNLMLIPQAIWDTAVDRDGSHWAAAIGVLTILILLLWKPFAPRRLAFIPASLVAVGVATGVVATTGLSVDRVTLPSNLLGAIHLLDIASFPQLLEWPIIELVLTMAFLASAETLLSATAADRLHQGPRTNYDRELAAQGIGNMLCGILGALPLTGVIIRSAANVAAGAQTRLSSILHGFWLLVFVAALPGLLEFVPTASLAAVLVVAVFKLVDVKALREIWQHDRWEICIYFVTASTIFFWGVLQGVLVGIGVAVAILLYRIGHLAIRVEKDEGNRRTNLHLNGTATFLNSPKLAAALEAIPAGTQLHIHLDKLSLIDHACLDLLIDWKRRHENTGGSLMLDWESLRARFGQRTAGEETSGSKAILVSIVHGAETAPQRRRFFREGWRPLRRRAS